VSSSLPESQEYAPFDVPEGVSRHTFRMVLTAYETAFRTKGSEPTLAQVRAVWPRISQKEIGELVKTDEFVNALKTRGIEIDRYGGLTHEQQVCIGVLADPFDKRQIAAKLKSVGIPMGRYLNWKKNPIFMAALEQQSAGAYREVLPELRNRLIERAEGGDMRAIELIFAKTGEYDPAAQNVEDARQLVLKVVESVLRHVKDVSARQAILDDIRGYGLALSAPPKQIAQ
jgi:hypothetical protein